MPSIKCDLIMLHTVLSILGPLVTLWTFLCFARFEQSANSFPGKGREWNKSSEFVYFLFTPLTYHTEGICKASLRCANGHVFWGTSVLQSPACRKNIGMVFPPCASSRASSTCLYEEKLCCNDCTSKACLPCVSWREVCVVMKLWSASRSTRIRRALSPNGSACALWGFRFA